MTTMNADLMFARRRVLLVGNPNVGKSALFNALTGLHTTVSNYPGTTVEVARGSFASPDGPIEVFDSPGVNSLLPLSEDERVTWDLLAGCAAGRHGRSSSRWPTPRTCAGPCCVTLQLGQLESPPSSTLNMSDEAEARGLRIDLEELSRALGVPVRPTVATRGEGIGRAPGCPRARHVLPRTTWPLPEDIAPRVASIFSGKAPLPDPEAPPPFVARYHEAMLAHAATLALRRSAAAFLHRRSGRRAGPPSRAAWDGCASIRSGAGRSCFWSSRRLRAWSGSSGRAPSSTCSRTGSSARYLNPWARAAVRPSCRARSLQDLFVGPVRRPHHGPDLRPRHRAAHRDHLLPGLRRARGLGIPAAPRGDE